MIDKTQPNSIERWNLVTNHRERLLRLARRKLPYESEAEDFAQEAMVRCVTFEGLDEARVGEFLTSTLLRLCVDHRRRRARAQRLSIRLESHEIVRHPEELVSERRAARMVLATAGTLRGRERQILLARADGMSTMQAAFALGITVKAAEGAFTRGRARIRTLCAEAC